MQSKVRDYLLLACLALLVYVGPPSRSTNVAPTGPVDRVVAIYESLNQPVAEASVMGGRTVQAIDKVGKWRQYDKDKIPDALKPAVSEAVAKIGVPCILLYRGGRVVASGRFPASDAELAAYVTAHGGF